MVRARTAIGLRALATAGCLALAIVSTGAGAARASMIDLCQRTDTALDPYAAAFAADGWEAIPPGAEADAALLAVVASYYLSVYLKVPDTPEKAATYLDKMRPRLAREFAGVLLFRKGDFVALVGSGQDGPDTYIRCQIVGDPLPEVAFQMKLDGRTPFRNLSYVGKQLDLAGAKTASIGWLHADKLPPGSGIPADAILYLALLPGAN